MQLLLLSMVSSNLSMHVCTYVPAISANCDCRSCSVFLFNKSIREAEDSNMSSTSKDFNFNCIRSTPAKDVRKFNAVVLKVSFPVFRGNGVCTNVSVNFIGCMMNFSTYICDTCAVIQDDLTHTSAMRSDGDNSRMLRSWIHFSGDSRAFVSSESTYFRSEIKSENIS